MTLSSFFPFFKLLLLFLPFFFSFLAFLPFGLCLPHLSLLLLLLLLFLLLFLFLFLFLLTGGGEQGAISSSQSSRRLVLTLSILANMKATHTASHSDALIKSNSINTSKHNIIATLSPSNSNSIVTSNDKNQSKSNRQKKNFFDSSLLALAATVAGCNVRTADRNNLFPRNRWIPSSFKCYLLTSLGCPFQVGESTLICFQNTAIISKIINYE